MLDQHEEEEGEEKDDKREAISKDIFRVTNKRKATRLVEDVRGRRDVKKRKIQLRNSKINRRTSMRS